MVLGSYNLGITFNVNALPVWGQTVGTSKGFYSHGGKGSNQAVAAAKFGAAVRFVGAVGDDAVGNAARHMLAHSGIDTTQLMMVSDEATGIGAIFLNAEGNNAIVIYPGANAKISPKIVQQHLSRWPQEAVLLTQLEVSVDGVLWALKEFKGLRILNPAPAENFDNDALDCVDILTPNETEARVLCGLDPDVRVPPLQLIEELAQRVPRGCIIMTMGSDGALIRENNETTPVPARAVHAVDTTGAGDIFNGILAAKLSDGLSVYEATRVACVGASLSVRYPGVVDSIPSPVEVAEVEDMLEHKRKD